MVHKSVAGSWQGKETDIDKLGWAGRFDLGLNWIQNKMSDTWYQTKYLLWKFWKFISDTLFRYHFEVFKILAFEEKLFYFSSSMFNKMVIRARSLYHVLDLLHLPRTHVKTKTWFQIIWLFLFTFSQLNWLIYEIYFN